MLDLRQGGFKEIAIRANDLNLEISILVQTLISVANRNKGGIGFNL
jgi:hypothetical protein